MRKHGCVGSVVLVTDLNHSPVQAALKKLNSIPAGSSIALKRTAQFVVVEKRIPNTQSIYSKLLCKFKGQFNFHS